MRRSLRFLIMLMKRNMKILNNKNAPEGAETAPNDD